MSSAISSVSGGFRPPVVSGASMRQPMSLRMGNLFDKIDASGTGSITKSQFLQAFQNMNPPKGLQAMGADTLFSKLDPTNSGSVSKQDFVTGMSNILAQLRAPTKGAAGADADGDSDGSVAAGDNQATGSNPITDLAAAMQSLESTLGGQPGSQQNLLAGTLFQSKA